MSASSGRAGGEQVGAGVGAGADFGGAGMGGAGHAGEGRRAAPTVQCKKGRPPSGRTGADIVVHKLWRQCSPVGHWMPSLEHLTSQSCTPAYCLLPASMTGHA